MIPTVPPPEKKHYRYRAIPEPQNDVESLQETVEALKEVVETLIGQRGEGGAALTESTAVDPMALAEQIRRDAT